MENMRTRKRKSDLPPKLCIVLITNKEAKQEKSSNENNLIHALRTDLDLNDYAQLHAQTHYQIDHQDDSMCDPLVKTILTQNHVSKGMKVFREPGVALVLK